MTGTQQTLGKLSNLKAPSFGKFKLRFGGAFLQLKQNEKYNPINSNTSLIRRMHFDFRL